jgi:hypothetical protein
VQVLEYRHFGIFNFFQFAVYTSVPLLGDDHAALNGKSVWYAVNGKVKVKEATLT